MKASYKPEINPACLHAGVLRCDRYENTNIRIQLQSPGGQPLHPPRRRPATCPMGRELFKQKATRYGITTPAPAAPAPTAAPTPAEKACQYYAKQPLCPRAHMETPVSAPTNPDAKYAACTIIPANWKGGKRVMVSSGGRRSRNCGSAPASILRNYQALRRRRPLPFRAKGR